jgi:hypothetical protein
MTQPGEDLHELDIPMDVVGRNPETPDADALEQAWPAGPLATGDRPRVPLEANEADAVEQAQVVGLDDDDEGYR